MSDAVVLPLRERGMRWVLVAGSVAIHAAAFFLFKVTGEVDLPGFAERTRVRAVVPSLERSGRYAPALDVMELLDSSLMALPSGPGFSGRMWGRAVPAARNIATWDGEPSYLEPVTPPEFPSLVKPGTLEEAARRVADGAAEPVVEEPLAVRSGGERVTHSVLRLSGDLADRAVVRSPTLPVIVSPVVLRPTRVRVGVAADGAVRYASVERGCGNEEVDRRAVEWARQLRFEPVNAGRDELMWGVARFLWATELPGNGAAPP